MPKKLHTLKVTAVSMPKASMKPLSAQIFRHIPSLRLLELRLTRPREPWTSMRWGSPHHPLVQVGTFEMVSLSPKTVAAREIVVKNNLKRRNFQNYRFIM